MKPPLLFKFKLYIAGDTYNSMQAMNNLNHFCQIYLTDRHEIEVIDVFKQPAKTLKDEIFMTPTLTKLTPPPIIKVVGTLSQNSILLQALGLDESPA